MKVLELPLKAKWYDMIESGVKSEEYREIKPYWISRFMRRKSDGSLLYQFKTYTHVRFRYGYTKRTMTFEIEGLDTGVGNTEWGAIPNRQMYIIKIGKKIC